MVDFIVQYEVAFSIHLIPLIQTVLVCIKLQVLFLSLPFHFLIETELLRESKSFYLLNPPRKQSDINIWSTLTAASNSDFVIDF